MTARARWVVKRFRIVALARAFVSLAGVGHRLPASAVGEPERRQVVAVRCGDRFGAGCRWVVTFRCRGRSGPGRIRSPVARSHARPSGPCRSRWRRRSAGSRSRWRPPIGCGRSRGSCRRRAGAVSAGSSVRRCTRRSAVSARSRAARGLLAQARDGFGVLAVPVAGVSGDAVAGQAVAVRVLQPGVGGAVVVSGLLGRAGGRCRRRARRPRARAARSGRGPGRSC